MKESKRTQWIKRWGISVKNWIYTMNQMYIVELKSKTSGIQIHYGELRRGWTLQKQD